MTARRLWPAALLLGAALIAGFTLLRGIDHFDEGLVLQAARRVASGEVPYADFRWPYGPAQPYLLGASFELFGTSLLGWRIVRVVVVALTALVVFALARRLAGTRLALLVWLIAACALAQPANASPFPIALLLGLCAVALAVPGATGGPARRRALAAGAVAGLAAAFRLDFGVYGAAAAVAAALTAPGTPRARLERAAWVALGAVAVTAAAYAPFALAAGPGDLWEELIGRSLRERDYWTLPFPLAYEGPLRGWPPADLAKDLKDVLGFYAPLIALAGLGVAALAGAARLRAGRRAAGRHPAGQPRRPGGLPAAWVALLVLALAATAYLLSRADEFHATPLVLLVAVLLAAALAWRGARDPLGLAAAVVLALLLAYGASNRLAALLVPPATEPIDVAVADGVRTTPREARGIERMVAGVQRRVPPGEPIYVAPRRSDLVTFEDPMAYVLAERDNATGEDVGLRAGAREQARLIRALERTRPRVVVRWTDPLSSRREDNPRGRSSGVRSFDAYLARRYRVVERMPGYELLARRSASS